MATGKKEKQTFVHFDINMHMSACIQMQSYTASLRYVAVYMYSICLVSDAVLCMLTCRWNVTSAGLYVEEVVQVGLVTGLTH